MARSIAHIFLVCFFIHSAHSQVEHKKIGSLPAELKETSGLIYYQNKYLISHNDGGNPSELFVLNLKGELVKKIEFSIIIGTIQPIVLGNKPFSSNFIFRNVCYIAGYSGTWMNFCKFSFKKYTGPTLVMTKPNVTVFIHITTGYKIIG